MIYLYYLCLTNQLKQKAMNNTDNFTAHGFYTISNAGGYEIELSSDGEQARVRDYYGSDDPKVSDWLDIVFIPNSDMSEGADDMIPVIDPAGLWIPLNLVMRINR